MRELVAAEARHGVAGADAGRARRAATSTSSWSPASWPRLSLTSLKRSRSRNRPRSACRRGAARRARACSRRSRKSVRLGSPVSGSWRASWSELLLGALALGDVGLRAGEARRRCPGVAHREAATQHPAQSPSWWRMRCSLSKCGVIAPEVGLEFRPAPVRSSGWTRRATPPAVADLGLLRSRASPSTAAEK